MSIIQEALKKAERHIKDTKKAVPSVLPHDHAAPLAPPPAADRDPKAVAILLVVLIATAVFAASQLFPKKNIPARSSVSGLAATKPVAAASKNEEFPTLPGAIFQQLQPHDYTAAGQPPAQRLEEKKPAPPEFVLNGIMYLEGSPRAIINDVMVEAGDTVSGARVIKIEKKGVLLQYDDVEIGLNLK